MKFSTLMLILITFSLSVVSQSKKKIEEYGIVKKNVWITDYENGDEPYQKSTKKFNRKGKLIEEKKFDKAGKVIEYKKNTFNDKNFLIKKVYVDLKKRKAYTYNYKYNIKGQLVSESKFDKNKKLKYKKVFEYTGGKMSKETRYNSKDKIRKTTKYTYEGKLKKTKTDYDSSGRPIKKVEYNYKFNK